jgi:hypothetical protein
MAASFRNGAGQILAQALATTTNPARPGQVVQFTVSVTNRISAARAVYLYYDVPQFTTSEGGPAGTTFAYNIGNVAAGATKSMTLSFTVLSDTQAPPNSSLITLVVTDRVNCALVSRTLAVNSTLAVRERLNSPSGRLVLPRPLPEATALIFATCSGNDREILRSHVPFFREDRPTRSFCLVKP